MLLDKVILGFLPSGTWERLKTIFVLPKREPPLFFVATTYRFLEFWGLGLGERFEGFRLVNLGCRV